jgi:methionine-S-sulfoxide reductase
MFKFSTQVVAAVFLILLASAGGARLMQVASDNTAAPHEETATFSRGCFWGLQERLRQIPGVIKTRVGYTGGQVPDPTFEMVASGKTGHVEAVEVRFDPCQLSYAQLVEAFLKPRKVPGLVTAAGMPSRCVIFYHGEQQAEIARQAVRQIALPGESIPQVVVQIIPASTFYLAEDYHQDYYRKNSPAGGCSLF